MPGAAGKGSAAIRNEGILAFCEVGLRAPLGARSALRVLREWGATGAQVGLPEWVAVRSRNVAPVPNPRRGFGGRGSDEGEECE